MRKLLLAGIATLGLMSCAEATDPLLTIELTQWKEWTSNSNRALAVVTNRSDQNYWGVYWSCVFYNGDEPVHEDSFAVRSVQANSKTAATQYFDKVQFTSVACRVTDTIIDDPIEKARKGLDTLRNGIERDCLEGRSEIACIVYRKWQREQRS